MTRLVRTLATLEESLIALERRGISLKIHAVRQDPTGRLPVYHVFLGGREEWFTTRDELDNFVAAQEKDAGGKLNVDVGMPAPSRQRPAQRQRRRRTGAAGARPRLRIVELHEVRTINNAAGRPRPSSASTIDALIPQERTGDEDAALHAPPRRKRNRPRRPPRPARRHPRRRRKGPARSPASKAWAK